MLSDAYNDERRKLISRDKASLDFLPGSVEGFGSVVKMRRAEGHREAVGAMGAGEPTVGRFGEVRGDTVHFDIIDQAGNMISATPSGGWLQSSPVIPELGFCLGSRAQMFWLEENHPAALAPGKRPRTTLSPTMCHRDGEPYMAWGSPGGDQQDQWTTQFFLRHVHAKLNLQEAIDAPAWHSEHFPISFWPRTSRPGVLVHGKPRAEGDRGHVEEPWPCRRDRPRLVGRPPHRRLEGWPPPPRRRQSEGHARLRGGTVRGRGGHDLVDHRPRFPDRPVRHRGGDQVLCRRRPSCRISPPASAASPRRRWSIPITASMALALLREGREPRAVVDTLIAADSGRESRQLHVMDAKGRIAAFTGNECVDWCGHVQGDGFSIAGNMLAGAAVLDDTAKALVANAHLPFAQRLIAAMKAGEAAGGDKRGKQSAALLIHGEEEWSDLDLRVDDHTDPLAELERLEQVSRERWVHFRPFLPTRRNPAGITDRATIDAGVQAATAGKA